MPYHTISLAMVDDHVLFRQALGYFLNEQQDLSVACQASNVADLLSKLESSRVDILLMNYFLPQGNGREALKVIREEYPAIKILILSMCTDMDQIGELLDAGIHGYVPKTEKPEELVQAIYSLSQGRIYRNRIFTEALYYKRQHTITYSKGRSDVALNDRDKKILQLIWEEKSNKEIADELFLGIRSIEKIRQDLKEKIGVKSTVGLLKYAVDKRIVSHASTADQN